MKKSNPECSKQHRHVKLPVIIAAAAVLFGIIALARYMMQTSKSGIMEAGNFYFTSSLLKGSSENAVYTIDSGRDTFSVSLYNFADEKRVTSGDISYTVAVTGGTASAVSGSLTGGQKHTDTITITPQEKTVTVTAVSETPYKKTLTATFELAEGSDYAVEDKAGSAAAVLTMTYAGTESKAITLKLPEGAVPDAADERVAASGGNAYTYTLPEKGVYSLVILKTNTGLDLSRTGILEDEINLN